MPKSAPCRQRTRYSFAGEKRRKVQRRLEGHDFGGATDSLSFLIGLPQIRAFDKEALLVIIHNTFPQHSREITELYDALQGKPVLHPHAQEVEFDLVLRHLANENYENVIAQLNRQKVVDWKVDWKEELLALAYFFRWKKLKEGRSAAIDQLRIAMEMDPSCQLYVLYYCCMLLEELEVELVISTLETFRDNNRDNPLSHQMLGLVLSKYYHDDAAKLKMAAQCFQNVIQVDVVSPFAVQILTSIYLIYDCMVEDEDMMYIVTQYIDMIPPSPTSDNDEAWEMLLRIFEKAEEQGRNAIHTFFQSRAWWLHHHFPPKLPIASGSRKMACKAFFIDKRVLPS